MREFRINVSKSAGKGDFESGAIFTPREGGVKFQSLGQFGFDRGGHFGVVGGGLRGEAGCSARSSAPGRPIFHCERYWVALSERCLPESVASLGSQVSAIIIGTYARLITKRPYPDHAKVFWQAAQTVDGAIDAAAQGDPTEELARLAEFLPTLCWIGYGDGSLFWYNRRWHDYCGSTPEEMAGWGWQSVHDPAYLPEVVRRWSAAIAAGSPFEMTFPLRGADGQFRPFLTRVVPIRNRAGTIVRWLGTNTEISEQVKAERALEISEATYEVLTNAMPQMVWSTLPDGYHDYYNVKWYEFTGVPPGSTDGDGWSGIFHADDQPRAWDRWRHSLSTGEDYEIEYRLRHHSGKYRWVLGRAQPVRSDQGVITRWIGTCTDIDDAKRAAEQNELLSRELSHRIKNIFAVISYQLSLTFTHAPIGAVRWT